MKDEILWILLKKVTSLYLDCHLNQTLPISIKILIIQLLYPWQVHKNRTFESQVNFNWRNYFINNIVMVKVLMLQDYNYPKT